MFVVMLLAVAVMADAQQTGKIFRIGFLYNGPASGGAVLIDAFRQELSRLGLIDGKNITIEYRFAEQKSERLSELTADLVRLNVDLIVAAGTQSALTAKKATTIIPIVMVSSTDPVSVGLVASLARPGGNVTGLSGLTDELNTKRLEILKDAVPKLGRVGILRLPGSIIGQGVQLKELSPAAPALKLKLEEIETPSRRQRFRECLSNRKTEAGRGDYDDHNPPFFRRKKADRRACRQIPVAGYLLPEGVCR